MSASPFAIRRIVLEQGIVVLEACGVAETQLCPDCGTASAYVQGRYVRRPLDEPWRGFVVRLEVTVRRFRCPNPDCRRTTFAESFGAHLLQHAQRTTGCTALLREIAQVLGGEAGARLAVTIGVPVSADTLLRVVEQAAETPALTPRVLGVDDFALRRRYRYGTLLLDLETHQPVDLLEGRDAQTLATWLEAHPGVEVIVCDRAEAFEEGARVGAPEATLVADRFHLIQNATAAMNEILQGRRRRIDVNAEIVGTSGGNAGEARPSPNEAMGTATASQAGVASPPPLSQTKQREAERRARRVQRWEEVCRRHAAGYSLRQIAREMGLSRCTVRRLAQTPAPPQNAPPVRPRPAGLTSPKLQPFVSHLQDRWQAGCENVAVLFQEIVALGYTGSRSLLAQAVQPWRPPRPPRDHPTESTRQRFGVRHLCLTPPEHLTDAEQHALAVLREREPEIAVAYDLLQRFRAVIRDRDDAALTVWIVDAQASSFSPLVSFANGLVKDRDAVRNALTLPWSTGPVEGWIHKLKLIKRQGYGRAAFRTLRRRVLAA